MRQIGLCLSCFWILGLFAPSALANDDRERAGVHVQAGVQKARKGDFRGAITDFQTALKLYPHADIQHSLARAYEELGELATAYGWFRMALTQDDYTHAAEGRDRLAKLEAALRKTHAFVTIRTTPSQVDVTLKFADGTEEQHSATPFETWALAGTLKVVGAKVDFETHEESHELVAGEDRELDVILKPRRKQGFVQINVNVPGATVYVGDEKVGKAPLASMARDEGIYDVRVEAVGYDAITETVVVNADEVSTVNIALVATGGGDPKTPRDEGVPTWVGAGLVGLGGAAIIAGVVFHVEAFRVNDEANAIPISTDPAVEAEYDRLFNKAKDNQTAAFISYGVAVALVGTGVILLTVASGDDAPRSTSEAGTPGVQWTPTFTATPDGGGIGAAFTF